MAALDFKEIPLPTSGSERDQFELFARDLMELLGFKTIAGPDRGADGGRDLIVEENRAGIVGDTKVRWLVSCKHKAHSGSSVTPDDERDIRDRLQTHACQGFMGIYSTLPSSGLATKLNAAHLPYEIGCFDSASIETRLLASPAGIALARRYMPISAGLWAREHPGPAKIYHEEPELLCAYCSKDLLKPEPSGIYVEWQVHDEGAEGHGNIETVYWCCKGGCDQALERKYYREGLVDGWEDIPDVIAPVAYLRWFVTIINQQHEGKRYKAKAMENAKSFLINLFPLVSREMTEAEKRRIGSLRSIPSHFGGWG